MEAGQQSSVSIRSAWLRHFDFPDDILQGILRDRFKRPALLVQERMEILSLKAHGISHGQIAEWSCAARSTVRRTLDLCADGEVGLAAGVHSRAASRKYASRFRS